MVDEKTCKVVEKEGQSIMERTNFVTAGAETLYSVGKEAH